MREFDAQNLKKSVNAVFRRAVSRLKGCGANRFDARDVNQRAAVLFHIWQSGFCAVYLSEQIDFDQTLVFFRAGFFDRRKKERSRVMNPCINPPVAFDAFFGNPFDGRKIGGIGFYKKSLAAVLLDLFN